MYGGGLRWKNGELAIGKDNLNYERPELEAFHLLE